MWLRETRVGWVRAGLGHAKPSALQLCPNSPLLLGGGLILPFHSKGVPSHAGPGSTPRIAAQLRWWRAPPSGRHALAQGASLTCSQGLGGGITA